MFDYFFKQSKLYKALEDKNKYLLSDRETLETSIKAIDNERVQLGLTIQKLEEEKQSLLSAGGASIKEGNSSVIFEFDNDLKITVKSRINEDIIAKLIDEKYITAASASDEATIQFAFILLANEATEQIIEGVNSNEN